jgi:hypothetical protein
MKKVHKLQIFSKNPLTIASQRAYNVRETNWYYQLAEFVDPFIINKGEYHE